MKLIITDDDGTVIDSEDIDRDDLENIAGSTTSAGLWMRDFAAHARLVLVAREAQA